jgi:hypothetical protein
MTTPRILVLLAATAGLAACGGSATGNGGAADKPSAAQLSPTTHQKGTRTDRSNEVNAGQSVASVAGETVSGPAGSPCKLVTRTQAQTIIGGSVTKPLEAPQGPTCIYRYKGGKSLITLAVQSVDVKVLKRESHRPQPVKVSGRQGFCSNRGQPMLYVPVTPGRVLSISAPCQMAQQFAVRALRHFG